MHSTLEKEKRKPMAEEIFVVMGKPAVGKTEAVRTLQHMGFHHLNCRATVEATIGKREDLEEIRKRGGLWGDNLVNGIIMHELSSHRERKHGLDGFPRSVAQARRLLGYVSAMGAKLTVVEIFAPDRITIDRVAGRRLDHELRGIPLREDDDPVVHLDRLKRYRQYAPPVLKFFRENKVPVHLIDGAHKKEVVSNAIHSLILVEV